MPKMRTICVVTGSRAECGLPYWLMRGIAEDVALVCAREQREREELKREVALLDEEGA